MYGTEEQHRLHDPEWLADAQSCRETEVISVDKRRLIYTWDKNDNYHLA